MELETLVKVVLNDIKSEEENRAVAPVVPPATALENQGSDMLRSGGTYYQDMHKDNLDCFLKAIKEIEGNDYTIDEEYVNSLEFQTALGYIKQLHFMSSNLKLPRVLGFIYLYGKDYLNKYENHKMTDSKLRFVTRNIKSNADRSGVDRLIIISEVAKEVDKELNSFLTPFDLDILDCIEEYIDYGNDKNSLDTENKIKVYKVFEDNFIEGEAKEEVIHERFTRVWKVLYAHYHNNTRR